MVGQYRDMLGHYRHMLDPSRKLQSKAYRRVWQYRAWHGMRVSSTELSTAYSSHRCLCQY
eukprot:3882010-Rhodomonas_salina.5